MDEHIKPLLFTSTYLMKWSSLYH